MGEKMVVIDPIHQVGIGTIPVGTIVERRMGDDDSPMNTVTTPKGAYCLCSPKQLRHAEESELLEAEGGEE